MTTPKRPYLHPRVAAEIELLEDALARYRTQVATVQGSCTHERIAHMPWEPGVWLGPRAARRICAQCGLEEVSRSVGFDHFHTLASPFLQRCETDGEFYQHRLPHMPPPRKGVGE